MKKLYKILKSIIFTGLVLYGLMLINPVFMRKSLSKPWDMGNKIGGFYNEVENFPIMFFGTSHAYCSFEPLVIYERTGTKSYVFASQMQPLDISYRYIVEAINRNKPKIIFVDIHAAIMNIKEDYSVVHSYSDYIPLSKNKLSMILKDVPLEHKAQSLLPLISYHSRWSELKEEDFNFSKENYKDDYKGYVLLKGQSTKFKNTKNNLNAKELNFIKDEKFILDKLNSIDKIIEVARKNNIELYFVKTPIYDYKNKAYNERINFISNHIREKNSNFINFNDYWQELNLSYDDFYDSAHLNVRGAEKLNIFFSKFLLENKIILEDAADDKLWLKYLKDYNINKE